MAFKLDLEPCQSKTGSTNLALDNLIMRELNSAMVLLYITRNFLYLQILVSIVLLHSLLMEELNVV